MKKKIFLLFITICMFFGINNILYASSEYEIEDYRIDAIVNENGDMEVTEYLVYDFDSDMNGVFRDILYKYDYSIQNDDMSPTSSRYQASDVQDIKVYYSNYSFDDMDLAILENKNKLTNGMNGYYSLSSIVSDGYRKQIKLYTPVESGNKKYIKYEFVLKDVAVKYNDYSEIYWNFLGKNWECKIENLQVNVKLQNKVRSNNTSAYVHTYSHINSVNTLENSLEFNVKNIGSKTAVDARFIFSSEALQDVEKNYYEDYDFNELERIEKEEAQKIENKKISTYALIGTILLSIVIIILGCIIVYKKMKRVVKTGKDIDYYNNIPTNLSLVEYANLDSSLSTYANPNYMLATILNLVNRKIIIMDARKKAKKTYDSEYDYFMKINKDKVGILNTLSGYERYIINWLFNKEMDEELGEVSLEEIELNKRFKEISKSTSQGEKFRKYTNLKSVELKKKFHETHKTGIVLPCLIMNLILAFVCIIVSIFIDPTTDKNSLICLFPLFMINTIGFSVMYSMQSKPTEQYINDYYQIKGLRRYLTEYSLIKDRYPIEIALWDEYMVFATLLGIAKQVSKEFEEELVSQGYDNEYICRNYPFVYLGSYSSTIASSISTSTGSSSSGGYSGGGGGGGRRWRRWRSLLNKSKIFLLIKYQVRNRLVFFDIF